MIVDNIDEFKVAAVEQIRTLANAIQIIDKYNGATTGEERTAQLAALGVATYTHNNGEIVRIFQATEPTTYQPE